MKRAWNYLAHHNLIYTHACLIGWILTNYVCQMETIYLFALSLFTKRRKLSISFIKVRRGYRVIKCPLGICKMMELSNLSRFDIELCGKFFAVFFV